MKLVAVALVALAASLLAGAASAVLRYGTTWRRNGLVCSSKAIGLRCSNPAGHGFFMSRARSYRF